MLSYYLRNQFDALTFFSIISVTDKKGIIKDVNDKFCEISGYSRDELIGSKHNIINSGYHDNNFFKDLWRTIYAGKTWQGEIKNKTKNGSYYWVYTTIVPIFDEQNMIKEFFSIRINITERKETEQKIIKQNKALTEYGYVTSHNLRRPVCNILSILEYLDCGGDMKTSIARIKEFSEELEIITRLLNDITSQGHQNISFKRAWGQMNNINKIMLVDDDEVQHLVNAKLISLYDSNIEVISFTDPINALQYIEKHTDQLPDMILLDLNMPHLTGFQFLERLERFNSKNISVHILTSSINPTDIELSMQWECVRSFIQKPLNKEKVPELFEA